MRALFITLSITVIAWTAGTARAADKADVMAVVHHYVDALSKGQADSTPVLCTDSAVIIDDFPPHVWSGAGTCANWVKDFTAYLTAAQISDAVATLGKPRHVDVTRDRAYVVVPASFAYKLKGKPMRDVGATWTFALQKQPGGWRITGWAWSGGKDVPGETPAAP